MKNAYIRAIRRPANNKMQRTKHGSNGASPLILVLDGPET